MGEEMEKEKGVVMDTPERTQIATPLSKFEDSPVFNYINSLSPIEPVKTVHITQTFNSLSFVSLPSVFTSPHVSTLKESRFLRRHQFSDQSKSELTSENAKNAGSSEGISNIPQNPSKQQKDFGSGSSVTEFSVMPSCECTNREIELSRTLSYEPVSPDTKNVPEMAGPSASIVPFIREGSANGTVRSETEVEGIDPIEHNKELSRCDWDCLISNASEFLNFDSPSGADPKIFPTSITKDTTEPEASDAFGSAEKCASENPSGKGENLKAAAENQEIFATNSLNNAGEPTENIDNEIGSNLHRGMRRRCLVFEMVGSRKKHLEIGSTRGSLNVSVSNEAFASNDKCLVPMRAGKDSSRCILPGIGLHLNALATTSADYKVVKQEAFGSGGQLIIAPQSAAAYCTIPAGQESLKKLTCAPSLEKDIGPAQNGVLVVEDASKALEFVVNEELVKSSPRKKRRREGEACKRCNCKKSKCLKLYCECFAAGVYCVEPCSCQECFNKPIHEDTVLATRKQIESRNPLAFAPKVIRSSETLLEIGDESSKTPASARHKRGCNCKKSGCLKKYCECFQGGVGCSMDCRCEGCKNAFGRKDGSEMDLEVNDVDECEGNQIDRSMQIAEPISAIPATPSCFGRQPIPLPISSKSKPPRSFVAAIGSSSQTVFQAPGKFGKREGEIPDILHGNRSPIKSSSPNSKRVSPPHSGMGSSPGQKGSRKLILQSIPSFPSLTPKH